MKRTTLGWTALALAGLLIAAGAAYAASKIATQPIGLSSEPISAGRALAPKAARTVRPKAKPKPKATPRRTATPEPTRTATAAPTSIPTAAPTVDDHGGSSGGSGKGRDHPEDD